MGLMGNIPNDFWLLMVGEFEEYGLVGFGKYSKFFTKFGANNTICI
jgi:hypothetical protein